MAAIDLSRSARGRPEHEQKRGRGQWSGETLANRDRSDGDAGPTQMSSPNGPVHPAEWLAAFRPTGSSFRTRCGAPVDRHLSRKSEEHDPSTQFLPEGVGETRGFAERAGQASRPSFGSAAAAMSAILERLAAYHRELEVLGVDRADLIETSARILHRTVSGED